MFKLVSDQYGVRVIIPSSFNNYRLHTGARINALKEEDLLLDTAVDRFIQEFAERLVEYSQVVINSKNFQSQDDDTKIGKLLADLSLPI